MRFCFGRFDSARLVGIVVALAGAALAAADDLNEKLEKLNVRERTEHYVLAGTVSDARFKQFGQALEYIHAEYEKGFGDLLADKDKAKSDDASNAIAASEDDADAADESMAAETRRFRVIIFDKLDEYHAFGREQMGHSTEHSSGMFISRYDLLLILDDKRSKDDTFGTLFHEAFHQFMARHVPAAPTWINEGLATYYGTARPAGKGLRFNRPRRDYWKILRKVVGKDEMLPLSQVVNASHAQFYDQTPVKVSGYDHATRQTLYYAEAYTLVHMLASEPKSRKHLQGYLRKLAEGGPGAASSAGREFFDDEFLAKLTPFWIKYVKSNPEN